MLHPRHLISDAERPPAAADLAAFHTALLDLVDQSVILTDLEGRIRSWNAGATRIFGYPASRMLGRSVAELYPDVAPARLAEDLGRILAGEDFVGEWQGRQDGGAVRVRIRTVLVRGAGGEPVGFLGVARDVTDLRAAEAALARDRAGLRLIADTAPAYIVRCDAERRYTFANRAYAERFGLEPEQVVGKFIWDVVGEEAYAELRPHVDRVLEGERVEFEVEIPYQRIGPQYIQCAYAPELGPGGEVAGLVAVITDVSERKRAHLALRQSEARLALAQEAAGLALWSWDPTSGETSFSPEFYTLYGLAPEAPPPSFEEWRDRFLHPEDRPAVLEELEAARRGARPFDGQFRIVRASGEVRWVVSRGRLMPDGGGSGNRLVGVTFDVTRRREADLRLQQLDRLDSVARLAGGVAHEANNQMAVVLGASGFILRRDDLPEPVRQDAIYIREAAERTAAITQQLLAFSRRQLIRPRVLDLNATVLAFEVILRRTLGPDVALRVDLAPEPSRVRADEGQLQQVLLNLTLNARDAMPSGGTLRIATRQVALRRNEPLLPGVAVRPGLYVELAVRDTGLGMDPGTLSHLFEPFFTTKGVGRGTGLGLASVYGIVKQSQGYVTAESAPGVGTTMRVLLPLAEEQPAAADPGQATVSGGAETVLVVDDEPVVRTMMGRALEQAGYAVLYAESGAAALARAEEHAGVIHVLLSDLVMPGMSGRELARRLAERRPGLGVLFVSGFPGEEVERRGLLEGGRPFLAKPFTPETLIERVRGVADAARVSGTRI